MRLPVVMRPEAEVDLVKARDWYEEQRLGLGDEFTDAVDRLLSEISTAPQLYGVVLRDVRRTKVRRFPYVIYYRTLIDRVEVIGVLHGSRDDQVWRKRV